MIENGALDLTATPGQTATDVSLGTSVMTTGEDQPRLPTHIDTHIEAHLLRMHFRLS